MKNDETTPVCTFNTSPCVPAPRAHVETCVRHMFNNWMLETLPSRYPKQLSTCSLSFHTVGNRAFDLVVLQDILRFSRFVCKLPNVGLEASRMTSPVAKVVSHLCSLVHDLPWDGL